MCLSVLRACRDRRRAQTFPPSTRPPPPSRQSTSSYGIDNTDADDHGVSAPGGAEDASRIFPSSSPGDGYGWPYPSPGNASLSTNAYDEIGGVKAQGLGRDSPASFGVQPLLSTLLSHEGRDARASSSAGASGVAGGIGALPGGGGVARPVGHMVPLAGSNDTSSVANGLVDAGKTAAGVVSAGTSGGGSAGGGDAKARLGRLGWGMGAVYAGFVPSSSEASFCDGGCCGSVARVLRGVFAVFRRERLSGGGVARLPAKGRSLLIGFRVYRIIHASLYVGFRSDTPCLGRVHSRAKCIYFGASSSF